MAPEVYRRESYGKSVDVFSFALIVHEVSHIYSDTYFDFYGQSNEFWFKEFV